MTKSCAPRELNHERTKVRKQEKTDENKKPQISSLPFLSLFVLSCFRDSIYAFPASCISQPKKKTTTPTPRRISSAFVPKCPVSVPAIVAGRSSIPTSWRTRPSLYNIAGLLSFAFPAAFPDSGKWEGQFLKIGMQAPQFIALCFILATRSFEAHHLLWCFNSVAFQSP